MLGGARFLEQQFPHWHVCRMHSFCNEKLAARLNQEAVEEQLRQRFGNSHGGKDAP